MKALCPGPCFSDDQKIQFTKNQHSLLRRWWGSRSSNSEDSIQGEALQTWGGGWKEKEEPPCQKKRDGAGLGRGGDLQAGAEARQTGHGESLLQWDLESPGLKSTAPVPCQLREGLA